jgi:GDP/UDP-N,N'-diacetylbacillosamine 2-epimerase (hydrolysing)
MIDEYVLKNNNAVAFASMGALRYLSALRFVDAVVGNSSSGLLEAPSFKIGTINIGDRQKGRIKATSLIDCEPTKEDINKALKKLYSKRFQERLPNTINPYDNRSATQKIIKEIKKADLNTILKKSFYDL